MLLSAMRRAERLLNCIQHLTGTGHALIANHTLAAHTFGTTQTISDFTGLRTHNAALRAFSHVDRTRTSAYAGLALALCTALPGVLKTALAAATLTSRTRANVYCRLLTCYTYLLRRIQIVGRKMTMLAFGDTLQTVE
jgi:hypothetical protein